MRKRHILGRFINDSRGSSHLRPMHGDRHRREQMSFFGNFKNSSPWGFMRRVHKRPKGRSKAETYGFGYHVPFIDVGDRYL